MATVQFDTFELDSETGRLTCRGITRRLENQPQKVLSHLIEHRNRLVGREELIKLLWPDQIHGDFDHRLDKVLAKLRVSLNDRAAHPRFVETLRGRGFRFIAKVQSPETVSPPVPALAIEADAAVVSGFADRSSPAPPPPDASETYAPLQVTPRSTWWRGAGVPGATAVLTILLISFGYVHDKRLRPATPSLAASTTPSVLILGLRPASDVEQSSWIAQSMTLWLADDMEMAGKLHIVSEEILPNAETYRRSVTSAGLPGAKLAEIYSLTGADLLIFGTYEVNRLQKVPTWRIELWAQSTHRPGAIQQANALGTQMDGPALIREAQIALAAKLGLPAAGDQNPGLLQASLPATAAAARLYMEGQLAMAHADPLEASALLTQAVELEPDYAYTHTLLAEAWMDLGNRQKATQEYSIALRNAQQMSPRQQTELWALRCGILGDWDTVANVYTDLSLQYPGYPEYTLKIARARIAMGRGKEALRVLSAGADRGSTDRTAAQFALARSAAEARISQFDRQLADAALARQSAEATGQRLVAAKALVEEGNAHLALGHWSAAESDWQRAFVIFSLYNDRRGLAKTLYGQGRLAWLRREPSEARRLLEKSVELSEGFESDPDRAAAIAFQGVVYLYSDFDPHGETKVVEDLFAKANRIYTQTGDIAGQGIVRGLAGDLAICQSQYKKAYDEYAKALELSRQAEDGSAVAGRMLDLGIAASELGENSSAKDWYTQSVAAYRALGQQDRAALAQNRLANLLFREGDVDRAILLSGQSLSTLTAIGYTDNGVIEDLARFEVERNPATAERLARQSLNASTDKVDPRGLAGRYMVLAEAQLANNKLQDAKISIDHAFALDPVLINGAEGTEMLWARAEVNLHEGRLAQAHADLARALSICKRYGSKRYEMPVRLALAEVDLQSHSADAPAELELVQRDCQNLGYLLFARKAATDLKSVEVPQTRNGAPAEG